MCVCAVCVFVRCVSVKDGHGAYSLLTTLGIKQTFLGHRPLRRHRFGIKFRVNSRLYEIIGFDIVGDYGEASCANRMSGC